jgi:hypothetical protein
VVALKHSREIKHTVLFHKQEAYIYIYIYIYILLSSQTHLLFLFSVSLLNFPHIIT